MKKRILSFLLFGLARIYIWRFHPRIVGITGNVGKSSTKEAIAKILSTRFNVRATGGNMNNEIGLPVTIIGDFTQEYYKSGGTLKFWMDVFTSGIKGLFAPRELYPEILVLEYGVDHPGEMRPLVSACPPTVAVVGAIGDVPSHGEFFVSSHHLAEEKSVLAQSITKDGWAILSADDQYALDMRRRTRGKVKTFGTHDGADLRAIDVSIRMSGQKPIGVTCTLVANHASMPLLIRDTIGSGIATACAAGALVGQVFGIGLADSVAALTDLKPLPGRLRILSGIRDSILLDDTYNASPIAMKIALDALAQIPGRKIAVLGDMLELGYKSERAHEDIGAHASGIAQIIVCVGDKSRATAKIARDHMPQENVYWYADSSLAASEVQKLIQEGDVLLIKGSQSIRMERIVLEIMADPSQAKELLVRQSTRWLEK